MVKIAILVAAGWKGAGHAFRPPWEGSPEACLPLDTCPEALLPIGDGRTVISRTTDMLLARGFAPIFIATGRPGCLYPTVRSMPGVALNVTEEQASAGASQSPWTWKRLQYVHSLGIPILCPEPDTANYMDSYARVLDAVGYDAWDRAYLQQADLLLSEELLDSILGISEPTSILTLHPRHDVFQLDPEKAREFRRIIEPWRLKPHYLYEPTLSTIGIKHLFIKDEFPGLVDHWYDVDYTSSYWRVVVEGEKGAPSWLERHTHG